MLTKSLIASTVLASALTVFGTASVVAGEISCPPNVVQRTVDNVIVTGNCTIRLSTVEGNIVIKNGGNLLVMGSTIKGSVQAEGASRIRILTDATTGRESRINGDVQIHNLKTGIAASVVDAFVGGTIIADSNRAPINLLGNTINGDIQVFQNEAVVRLRDNTIGGNLQCKANTPRPVNGGGNVVGGNAEDQCARFAD